MPLMQVDTSQVLKRENATVLPELASREDESYLDFVESLRSFVLDGMQFDQQLATRTGHLEDTSEPPEERLEKVREIAGDMPVARVRDRLMRSQQEMKWRRIVSSLDARRDIHLDRLEAAEGRGPAQLELNPDFEQPEYANVHFHLQPDGYHKDPLAGFRYHYGTKVFFVGDNDKDQLHASLVNNHLPLPADGRVERILDLACSVGQSTTALKQRFPQADVTGIDHSEPMLRCAHHRAVELGIDVCFSQRLVENTGYDDDSFDIVFSFILFHEIPMRIIRETLAEVSRVLRPGGMFAVYDFMMASGMTPAQLYHRHFDSRHNGEAYGDDFCYTDFDGLLKEFGFVEAAPGKHLGTTQVWYATLPG
ncbi:MAG: class I SAM-dependent methyltransferase [Gammaproteobacteria bacterium]|nr:class I SAM-dependent methyltransferase [Gammaproteobacteria bacterium]